MYDKNICLLWRQKQSFKTNHEQIGWFSNTDKQETTKRRQMMAVNQPVREGLEEAHPANTLISDSWAPQTEWFEQQKYIFSKLWRQL